MHNTKTTLSFTTHSSDSRDLSSAFLISSILRFPDFATTTTMSPELRTLTTVLLPILAAYLAAAAAAAAVDLPQFREAPAFRNGRECPKTSSSQQPIHIAMTLDTTYLRGSVAGVFSVLQHANCPENIVFHFLAAHRRAELRRTILTTFPYLSFHLYHFDTNRVKGKISSSIRRALDQPLNYARIYLADLLPSSVNRIIYFDSDLIVVDDIAKLWNINLNSHVLGAPEYCHANFTTYFTPKFWSNPAFSSRVFRYRDPCYFNTGVMVIDLQKWRQGIVAPFRAPFFWLKKTFKIFKSHSTD